MAERPLPTEVQKSVLATLRHASTATPHAPLTGEFLMQMTRVGEQQAGKQEQTKGAK
jgi:hypothetical protein